MEQGAVFKVGDSIVVKPNIKDPDTGFDIAGWQGRVVELDQADGLICIEWDTITLKNITYSVIQKAEAEGWIWWDQVCLEPSEFEATTPRDSIEEVVEMIAQLEAQTSQQPLDDIIHQHREITIKKIDVLSLGELLGLLYGCVGLIAAGFMTIFSPLSAAFSPFNGNILSSLFFGMGSIIALPIIYGIIGFIMGITIAVIYNTVVDKLFKGLKLEIEG